MSKAGYANPWYHGCDPTRQGEMQKTNAKPLVYFWIDFLFALTAWLIAHKQHMQVFLNESTLPVVMYAATRGLIPRYDLMIGLVDQSEEVGPLGTLYQPRTSEIITEEIEEKIKEDERLAAEKQKEEAQTQAG